MARDGGSDGESGERRGRERPAVAVLRSEADFTDPDLSRERRWLALFLLVHLVDEHGRMGSAYRRILRRAERVPGHWAEGRSLGAVRADVTRWIGVDARADSMPPWDRIADLIHDAVHPRRALEVLAAARYLHCLAAGVENDAELHRPQWLEAGMDNITTTVIGGPGWARKHGLPETDAETRVPEPRLPAADQPARTAEAPSAPAPDAPVPATTAPDFTAPDVAAPESEALRPAAAQPQTSEPPVPRPPASPRPKPRPSEPQKAAPHRTSAQQADPEKTESEKAGLQKTGQQKTGPQKPKPPKPAPQKPAAQKTSSPKTGVQETATRPPAAQRPKARRPKAQPSGPQATEPGERNAYQLLWTVVRVHREAQARISELEHQVEELREQNARLTGDATSPDDHRPTIPDQTRRTQPDKPVTDRHLAVEDPPRPFTYPLPAELPESSRMSR
ncbi:hypothetical protein ACRAKI_35945 [Saccharothrix isguenensis]